MDTREHFRILADYNRAANEAVYALVAALPPEQYERPCGSYFKTLRGLLGHLVSGDLNWLRRFRLLYPELPVLAAPLLEPAGAVWTPYKPADFASLERDRRLADRLWIDFVAQADPARLDSVLGYQDSHGNPRRYVAWQALDHVFNHQTHHRGQVSQILDELGVEHDFSNLLDVLTKA
jgi:uncharacterized damage-inducible protein DinB